MSKKVKKIILFVITLLVMLSIFDFSSHTGTESSGLSLKVTRFISRIIFRGYGGMTPAEQLFIVNGLHHFVRKLAHFSIYAALGLAVYLFLDLWDIRPMITLLISWAFCSLYACTDEFHQSLTPGRAMQFRDVLIDSAGSFCGCIAAIVLIAVVLYITDTAKRKPS